MSETSAPSHPDYDQAWIQAIADLSEHSAGENPYNLALLRQCKILGLLDNRVFLAVPSDMVLRLIEDQYQESLLASLVDFFGFPLQLSLTVDKGIVPQTPQPPAAPASVSAPSPSSELSQPTPLAATHPAQTAQNPPVSLPGGGTEAAVEAASSTLNNTSSPTSAEQSSQLNPKYTFEAFVVGSSNRMAAAAAAAVADTPAVSYNPLFIYGGSGLGKTHLLHAIGNMTLRNFPHYRVQYVSSEEFTNDFINSIREERIAQFQARYRENDLLLIDDIQFLQGKEQTLNEFFHTFNTLYNAQKQMVITSDVPPKYLDGFEERLRTRFASGLMTDIQTPDLETRLAILQKKAEHEDLQLPMEVMEYIANRISDSIRELEGAVIRVTAFASLSKKKIDVSLAQMALKDLIKNTQQRQITPELILEQTAKYFSLEVEDLLSPDRTRHLVDARQVAMYLCREMTELSTPQIGQSFGGRDHSTVLHSINKVTEKMKTDQRVFDDVSKMTSLINEATTEAPE